MNARGKFQGHILIVDDEPLVRETVQLALQSEGYSVAEAEDGPQALAQFEPGKFALIITDYYMPKMTGDQLATAIKRRSPEQPVLMLTAFPELFPSRSRAASEIDALIDKPFEIDTLRDVVARCSPVPKRDQ